VLMDGRAAALYLSWPNPRQAPHLRTHP
jgi:hypothetical protein